jgi:hypothetical protein
MVVAKLIPDLECCYLFDEDRMIERYFNVPFDPHDYKYWSLNPYWKALYNNYQADKLGLREQVITKDDIVYDVRNGERMGRVKLKFFQTHKEFTCSTEEDTCNEITERD